ncbi:hypothetical protein CUMW_260210 [Citrus unshiu]|uniref:Uncharacterized protein n=1 Tax=Citrus unshiu TaxID=55188 RepID=A0A2H5QTH6_CITUN|nr:hypothetical protein CUMW_260210 [Citrus unshiu]
MQVQGLTEVPDIWKWEGLRRVSLMSNKTEKLSEIPSDPHLLTLLLQRNYLEMINNDFFQSMHSLRVLNLSSQVVCLKKLPNLKSVYGKALRFPDVCRFFVSKCPELKKLTLDFERAGQGKILIKGKENRWEQLQWEDQATQDALLLFFKSTDK